MSDWSTETADSIERIISSVRDKSVVPANKAVRGIVFGLIIGMLLAIAGIALFFGTFQLLDRLIPGNVWAIHTIFAVLFFAAGALLWSKRAPLKPE